MITPLTFLVNLKSFGGIIVHPNQNGDLQIKLIVTTSSITLSLTRAHTQISPLTFRPTDHHHLLLPLPPSTTTTLFFSRPFPHIKYSQVGYIKRWKLVQETQFTRNHISHPARPLNNYRILSQNGLLNYSSTSSSQLNPNFPPSNFRELFSPNL